MTQHNDGERLTLIRRGERSGAQWWQEVPDDQDPDSLRSVGYEVRTFVPASRADALAEAVNAALRIDHGVFVKRGWPGALADLRGILLDAGGEWTPSTPEKGKG